VDNTISYTYVHLLVLISYLAAYLSIKCKIVLDYKSTNYLKEGMPLQNFRLPSWTTGQQAILWKMIQILGTIYSVISSPVYGIQLIKRVL
jgi:hypothetical protein